MTTQEIKELICVKEPGACSAWLKETQKDMLVIANHYEYQKRIGFAAGHAAATDTFAECLGLAFEALREISADFGTDYCDGNCMTARLAIEKIESKLKGE